METISSWATGGAGTIVGHGGNDFLNGGAWGDRLLGGEGDDFLAGGVGWDRFNGGPGADRFFHSGYLDNRGDWIPDYNPAEGDVLNIGRLEAQPSGFAVNFADADSLDPTREAFITYFPTGQFLWALLDGEFLDAIIMRSGLDHFDLLS
ncbi:hypothetical protein [Jannaschia seosinensis]|uniref:hypothetical protein n=1 Tax=Jannaschia seosinensis TaxID=313367 RepID=UPI0006E1B8F9|nr:hypothetical protein [Jannaschia seosinensis]